MVSTQRLPAHYSDLGRSPQKAALAAPAHTGGGATKVVQGATPQLRASRKPSVQSDGEAHQLAQLGCPSHAAVAQPRSREGSHPRRAEVEPQASERAASILQAASPSPAPSCSLTSDEALGAINRVEHPAELRVRLLRSHLLAENAVRWVSLPNLLSHCRLGIAVRRSHGALCRRPRRLELGLDWQSTLPPEGHHFSPCNLGQLDRKRGELVEERVGQHGRGGRSSACAAAVADHLSRAQELFPSLFFTFTSRETCLSHVLKRTSNW
eukprot:scaffold64815_cov34-Tisochrysis_lutea.AAC.8